MVQKPMRKMFVARPLCILYPEETFSIENANLVRLLLQFGMDVSSRDKHLETPLHFASSRGHFEIALALLDHGADVNAQNDAGYTPLHRVSLSEPVKVHRLAQLMLERGADVNARGKDKATPLHFASYMSKFPTARVLLDHGANIHAKNVQGQTPLHMVPQCVRVRHEIPELVPRVEVALVELLLSRGADVNARDDAQVTPFLFACLCLKPKAAEKLLQNGADINAVNIHGQNAWHLISKNLSYNNREPLRARLGELLLAHGLGMHTRDQDERTPLHLACYYGQVDVAEMLLDHGELVDAEDIRGHTPLHQVPLGNYDYQSFGMRTCDQKSHPSKILHVAERLLEGGADVNAKNKEHETPLHLASRHRLHDMARFLLNHGADVNVKNSEGKSLLEIGTIGLVTTSSHVRVSARRNTITRVSDS